MRAYFGESSALSPERGQRRAFQPVNENMGSPYPIPHDSDDLLRGNGIREDNDWITSKDIESSGSQSGGDFSDPLTGLLSSPDLPDGLGKQAPMEQKSLSHIAHLNGLRALAFLGVLLFHFKHGTHGGFLGVDVFFVLSGYLMTRSIRNQLETGTFSYASFLRRRFWRLYPALLCTILGTLGLTYLFFSNSLAIQIARSAESSLFAVSNVLFRSEEGYFGTSSALKPLLHTWSLSVEWQFYLLWPVIMVILHHCHILGIWSFTALSALSFGFGWYQSTFDPTGAFFFLPGRAFEFGLGAIALTASPTITSKFLANVMSSGGTALIATSFLVLDSSTAAPALIAIPPLAGAIMIILSPSHAWANKLYTAPPMEYLGKISYSAYLVHWPVYVFFKNLYEYEDPPVQIEAVVLFVMMVVSATMYHFVEDKMRTGKNIRHKVLGVCLFFITLIVSHHCMSTSGWNGRFSNGGQDYSSEDATEDSQTLDPMISTSSRKLLSKQNDFNFQFVSYKEKKFIKASDKFDGIVIGDSFAEPTLGVFQSIATKHNLSFAIGGAGACPPFFDKASLNPKVPTRRISRNCVTNQRKKYIKFIKDTKTKTLFIVGNWYFAPELWQESDKKNHFNPNITRFEESIMALTKFGKKIVVIGQSPGPHFNPKLCLAAKGPLAFLKKCPTRFRIAEPLHGDESFLNVNRDRGLIRHAILRLFQSSAGFKEEVKKNRLAFVDPYRALCDLEKGDCAAIIDGEPMFRDNSHLTRNGSKLMENRIYASWKKLQK